MHVQNSSGPAYKMLLLIMFISLFSVPPGTLFIASETPTGTLSAHEIDNNGLEIAQTPTKSPREKKSETPAVSESPAATPGKSPSASESPAAAPGESPSASESPAATPGESPSASVSPPATPADTASPRALPWEPGFDIEQYREYLIPVAAGIGGLIVILIIVMMVLKRKQKNVCERCGKRVFPGMVYCEDCSEQGPSRLEPERVSAPVSTPSRDEFKGKKEAQIPEPPKVKPRPSGRVIAVLTVRRGANQGYRLNFYETLRQITIGTDAECDMVIQEDEEVSARHSVITMSEDTSFLIHDMGNTSGLFVNGERVSKSGLKSGDVIRVGKTELTFARL